MFTQLWRFIYLVHLIIEKTPVTISFFISTLLICFNDMLGIYHKFVSDPSLSKYLTLQKKESSKTYLCGWLLTRYIDLKLWEFPPLPELHESEFVSSLMLMIQTISSHMMYLIADHHTYFVEYLCKFIKVIQPIHLLTTVLSWIRQWIESEEEIVNFQDLTHILNNTMSARNIRENVTHLTYISEYWQLIYAIYMRYVL